jgi:hypothetical protein
MATDFNGYHKWLGIPPEQQPPNHYRLLGLAEFEPDAEVIEGAADRQMAHLRTFQTSAHAAQSQKILNEIAQAKLCLLDSQRKAAYDSALRAKKANQVTRRAAASALPVAKPLPPGDVAGGTTDDGPSPPLIETARPTSRRSRRRKRTPILTWGTVAVAAALAIYAAFQFRDIGSASKGDPRKPESAPAGVASANDRAVAHDSIPKGEKAPAATSNKRDAVASDDSPMPDAPSETAADAKPSAASVDEVAKSEDAPKASLDGAGHAGDEPSFPTPINKESASAPSEAAEPAAADDDHEAPRSLADLVPDRRTGVTREQFNDETKKVKARAASARSVEQLESLAMDYWSLVTMATELDDYDHANRFAATMVQTARKTRDDGLELDLQARAKHVQELRSAFNAAKPASASLRNGAADAKANGVWGKFLACWKDNWREALPLLANGGDDVAAIAARELEGPKSPQARVVLADDWWQVAEREKGTVRRAMEEHACSWYERALPELEPTERQATVKKIDRIFEGATIWEMTPNASGVQLEGKEVNIGEVATIEFWVNTKGQDMPLLTKRQSDNDQSITFYSKGVLADCIGDAPFYRVDIVGSEPIADGRWHHVAAVKRGKALSLMVDGRFQGTTETLESFKSASAWVLGDHPPWHRTLGEGRFCRLRISTIARYHPPFEPDRLYERDQYTAWMR